MDTKTYFGTFDLDGYEYAIAYGEIQKHIMCSYYAGWINPDGRIHAVSYHTAYNPTKADDSAEQGVYTANYALGLIRWYSREGSETGISGPEAITEAQADTLAQLVERFETPTLYEKYDCINGGTEAVIAHIRSKVHH